MLFNFTHFRYAHRLQVFRDLQIQRPLHSNGVTPVNFSTPDGHTLFLWVLLGQNLTFPPSPPPRSYFISVKLNSILLNSPRLVNSCNSIEYYISQDSEQISVCWDWIFLFCFQLRKNILSPYAYVFLFLPYHDYAGYADQSFVYQLVIWKMKTVIFPWSPTGIQ